MAFTTVVITAAPATVHTTARARRNPRSTSAKMPAAITVQISTHAGPNKVVTPAIADVIGGDR